MQAMEISRTALDVEWRRLEIIADNLAHADAGRTGEGGSFRALNLISGPKTAFPDLLENEAAPRHAEKSDVNAAIQPVGIQSLAGVAVLGAEQAPAPDSATASDAATATSPSTSAEQSSVDHAEQMLLLIKTSRAYEANIVAMNTARQMYSKALELGRRG